MSPTTDPEIVAMYQQGMSVSAIAKQHHIGTGRDPGVGEQDALREGGNT